MAERIQSAEEIRKESAMVYQFKKELNESIDPKKRECVEAEDGKFYQWDDEKGKWYFYDPERRMRLPGCPRKTLPQAGPKGLTERGKPRVRETKPERKATRADSERIYRRTAARKQRKHKSIEKKIAEKVGELKEVEEELTVAQQLQQMISRAPSMREQRKAILALFIEKGFSPIAEMIDMLQDEKKLKMLKMSDRLSILKTLSEFEAPKPKTIDIEGDIKSSMTINVIDFTKATQKGLKQAEAIERDTAGEVLDLTDEDYDEFESEVT